MAFGSFFGSKWASVFGSKFGDLLFGGADTSTELEVTITHSASPVISSADYTYEVVVENVGVNDAENVVCEITLDGDLTYVSAVGTDWVCNESGGVITCEYADPLATGVAPTITVTVTSPAATDTMVTTADAEADNADPAVQDDASTSVLLVPKDATSGKRVPLTQAEWDNVFTLAGVTGKTVHSSWGFQDAASPIVATVGTDLTAVGVLDYQQAQAGWTRLSVNTTVTAGERAAWALGVGPSPGSVSALWIGYINTGTGADRSFLTLGQNIPNTALRVTSGGNMLLLNGANSATGTEVISGAVHLYAIQTKRSATAHVKGFNELEKLTCTYTAPVDGVKGFGTSGTPPAAGCLWLAHFSGADAEWTEAELKAVGQTLGWTVAWAAA